MASGVASFFTQLRTFSTQLEQDCADLRAMVEFTSPRVPDATCAAELLQRTSSAVNGLKHEFATFQASRKGTPSFEDVLANAEAMYDQNQLWLDMIEGHLAQYGYLKEGQEPPPLEIPTDENREQDQAVPSSPSAVPATPVQHKIAKTAPKTPKTPSLADFGISDASLAAVQRGALLVRRTDNSENISANTESYVGKCMPSAKKLRLEDVERTPEEAVTATRSLLFNRGVKSAAKTPKDQSTVAGTPVQEPYDAAADTPEEVTSTFFHVRRGNVNAIPEPEEAPMPSPTRFEVPNTVSLATPEAVMRSTVRVDETEPCPASQAAAVTPPRVVYDADMATPEMVVATGRVGTLRPGPQPENIIGATTDATTPRYPSRTPMFDRVMSRSARKGDQSMLDDDRTGMNMFPLMNAIGETEYGELAIHLRTLVSLKAINTIAERINEFMTDKRFDINADDGDTSCITQDDMVTMGLKQTQVKPILLMLLELKRVQLEKHDGESRYRVLQGRTR